MRPAARRFALAVAATLCTHCSTVATEPTSRVWPASLSPCTVAGSAEPARCATVNVAESGEIRGRQLSIRIIVLPARSDKPAPDPLLMLAGGPGQGAADLAQPLAERAAGLRDDRDLVLIDQRGSGQSNGLHCQTPRATRDLMGRLFDPVRLADCRGELEDRADLTRYTTSAAAEDYRVVLDALGYQQVNVWGTSYGTRLAFELARRYPNRIRTLLLDGVVPPTFDWPTSGAPDLDAAVAALIEDCAADADCSRDFPRFERDIDDAFANLKRNRVTATLVDPATRTVEQVPFGLTDLAYSMRGLLYGREALALPQLFRAAAAGNYDGFAQAYVARARTLDRQIARGLHLSVYCAEDLPFVDWDRARGAAADTRMRMYLLDEYRRACDGWPRANIPDAFRESVSIPIPTLLMAGRRDPVTPPRTAENASRLFPRSRVVIWKYGGHGFDGLASPDCRAQIIATFIATADPDSLPVDCVARAAMLPFKRN